MFTQNYGNSNLICKLNYNKNISYLRLKKKQKICYLINYTPGVKLSIIQIISYSTLFNILINIEEYKIFIFLKISKEWVMIQELKFIKLLTKRYVYKLYIIIRMTSNLIEGGQTDVRSLQTNCRSSEQVKQITEVNRPRSSRFITMNKLKIYF